MSALSGPGAPVVADIAAPCVCKDDEVKVLQELVAAGHDQREVSHLLWGDPTRASSATSAAFSGRCTRLWIRRSMEAAFPWLRLPASDEVA